MQEIELNVLNIDRDAVREKLKFLGAEMILPPTLFSEIYFEPPEELKHSKKLFFIPLTI